jgi:hypothetical protein
MISQLHNDMLNEMAAKTFFSKKDIMEIAIETIYSTHPWPTNLGVTLEHKVCAAFKDRGTTLERWALIKQVSPTWVRGILRKCDAAIKPQRPRSLLLVRTLEAELGMNIMPK